MNCPGLSIYEIKPRDNATHGTVRYVVAGSFESALKAFGDEAISVVRIDGGRPIAVAPDIIGVIQNEINKPKINSAVPYYNG